MKRYIRSDRHYSGNKYIVVLQDGELMKHDDGRIMQLNDEVETASVDSLAEASAVVRDYIKKKNLGGSTFTGGQVLDAHSHEQIARISYNGRIWDLDDNEITDISASDATDEWDDLTDAVLNNKPYDYDRFHEYWQAFHQPEEGAIRADQVKVGDVIKNTESADEFDIGDVFKVNSIKLHSEDWEEFDYTFNITLLDGAELKYVDAIDTFDVHYMADEYVGVPVTAVNASTQITASKKVEISQELRSILEDVMIDTLENYSGPRILKEFVENARYLQVWDEYDEAHPDEMDELSWLSNNKLVDIGAEILDEINANWSGDEV